MVGLGRKNPAECLAPALQGRTATPHSAADIPGTRCLIKAKLQGIKGQVAQQEGAVAGKDAAPPLTRNDGAQRGQGVLELACGWGGGAQPGRARGL
jgi:hypothetical protein